MKWGMDLWPSTVQHLKLTLMKSKDEFPSEFLKIYEFLNGFENPARWKVSGERKRVRRWDEAWENWISATLIKLSQRSRRFSSSSSLHNLVSERRWCSIKKLLSALRLFEVSHQRMEWKLQTFTFDVDSIDSICQVGMWAGVGDWKEQSLINFIWFMAACCCTEFSLWKFSIHLEAMY